jgi:integrase
MLAIKHTIFRNEYYHFNIRTGNKHYRRSLRTDSPKQTRKYVSSIQAFIDKEASVSKSKLDNFIELLITNQLNHVVRLGKAATQPLSDTSKNYFSRWYSSIDNILENNWNTAQHGIGHTEEIKYRSFNDFIGDELENSCKRSNLRDIIIPSYLDEEGNIEGEDTEHEFYYDFLYPTKSSIYYDHLSSTIDTHSQAMSLALKNKQHLRLRAEFNELKAKFSLLLPNELAPIASSTISALASNKPDSPYLKDIEPDILSFINKATSIESTTKKGYKSGLKWVFPALGNYRISEINEDILEDVWNCLLRFPKRSKAKDYGVIQDSTNIEKQIKNIWDYCEGGDIEVSIKDRIAKTTLKEIKQALKCIFNWATRNNHLIKSPLVEARLKTDGSVTKRTMLPLSKAREITVYCLKNLHEPESWAILLMAYHGMRNEEVTSLTRNNIITDDESNVVFINILDGKTTNAKRRIPIHNAVLKAGFMEYVDKREDSLFDLTSRKLTLKFNHYRELFQIPLTTEEGELLNLYSLRHNVITQLQDNKDTKSDHIYKLVGHGNKNITINYTHSNYLLFQTIINNISYD